MMFSVIIPLYNKEPIIERTIRSVLSQSYGDFELVIVNDGSTDGGMNVVRSIHDDRIVLVEQENGGPSKARNTGTKNAKGEWVVFLDADDELLPDALQTFKNLVDEHPEADIIDCCEYTDVSRTKTTATKSIDGYSKLPLRDWYYRKIVPGSNQSIFKKCICLSFPYNENLRRYEDVELLMRMLPVSNVFSSTINVAVVHTEYASASTVRKNISDDYVGHLSLKGSFWKQMCVFQLFVEERDRYPEMCHKLYPLWYYRYDMLLLYKLFNMFK